MYSKFAIVIAIIIGVLCAISVKNIIEYNRQEAIEEAKNPFSIYDMEMGDTKVIRNSMYDHKQWTRVPGGWTLRTWNDYHSETVFIPYSEEGKLNE